ncbi:MAG: hypothetical protein JWQ04_3031 [Pedosphaera sp.]|nr:hypothetical protein [Pedosphaera sp.]
MKTKVAFIILALIAIGLGIGLISLKNQAAKQHEDDVATILVHSNQVTDVTTKLEEQKQVNLTLQQDLATRKEEYTKLSNVLSQTTESLTKTEAELKAQKEETAKRDTRITELEGQNATLDKQAVDLKGSINNLEVQIASTQKKLDASEGDKAFLTKELNRLMVEKAELERQFNDLAVLRTQVKKLKEELSVARRLEWIRQGLFARQSEKGAQQLMERAPVTTVASTKPAATNAYDLNVEVKSDGSVKVIPPLTNPPSAVPPPARQ